MFFKINTLLRGEVKKMAEKPTAAFVLSLVGGVLILVNAIIVLIGATIAAAIASVVPVVGVATGVVVIAYGLAGLVIGILVIVGAIMINSGNPGKVRTWSIIVLVFSVISILIGGGFIIGLVLGLVGGILGLVWKPSAPPPPSPT